MICIPLKTWMSWTDEEKSQVARYYKTIGKKYYIDFTSDPIEVKPEWVKDPNFPYPIASDDLQKDKDEYREDMSLGGKPYKEP